MHIFAFPIWHRSWLYNSRSKEVDDAKKGFVSSIAQKTLLRVAGGGPRISPAGTGVTALAITESSASLTRSLLQLVPSAAFAKSRIESGLGFLSSGIGLWIGSAVTAGRGVYALHKSCRIGDREGMERAESKIFLGTVSANASALLIAHRVVSTSAILGLVSQGLLGVESLLNMGISGWGIYRCARFSSQLDEVLAKKKEEKGQIVAALRFLKEKITPTVQEQEAIAKEVEKLHPKWGAEEKRKETEKKILDLSEVKFRFVKRRTSKDTALRVLKEVDEHLNNLSGTHFTQSHLKAAKQLLKEVKEKNQKKILLSVYIILASIIALTALIVGSFVALAAFSLILYSISSAMILGILVYPLFVSNVHESKVEAVQHRGVVLAPVVSAAG